MFEDLKELKELKGFDADRLFRYLMGKCHNKGFCVEVVHDGAVDAWSECLAAGDFTDVVNKAVHKVHALYQAEYRRNANRLSFITPKELENGMMGVCLDADEDHNNAAVQEVKVEGVSISIQAKNLLALHGEGAVDKLREYLRLAVKELGMERADHLDYDAGKILVAYYCDKVTLLDIYNSLSSFKSYTSLSHMIGYDLKRIQKWTFSDRGREVFKGVFNYDPKEVK